MVPNKLMLMLVVHLRLPGWLRCRGGHLNPDLTSQILRPHCHAEATMNHRWNLLYILASLVALTMPTVHGAEIDLDQYGLTGLWYDPRTSGQGFAVEVFPDVLSQGRGIVYVNYGIVQASWFTYDNVVGGAERQRWYTLSGPVVSGQTHAAMTIYQNTGGNFNAQPSTSARPVGTATLSFDSCTSGQLVYSFADGSERASTIPLMRVMPNVTCSAVSARQTNADFAVSGNWYDRATSDQGLAVEVNPISRELFFAWATYAPNSAGAGPAGQRWYTGQGPFAPGSSSTPVQLYETTGGSFDEAVATAPTTVAVGSGTLSFPNCAEAELSFNFSGGSSKGMAGTIALVRIGPVPIDCTSRPWDYVAGNPYVQKVLSGRIDSIDPAHGTLSILGLRVQPSVTTLATDVTGSPIPVTDLKSSDFVEVTGFVGPADGVVTAQGIRRFAPTTTLSPSVFTGDGYVSLVDPVIYLSRPWGLTITTDANTSFQWINNWNHDPAPLSRDQFFAGSQSWPFWSIICPPSVSIELKVNDDGSLTALSVLVEPDYC
jgi:hypothetical protein